MNQRALWCVFSLFFLAAASAQGKESVQLKANHIFRQQKEQTTFLDGEVEAETSEWKMKADQMEIWEKENLYLLSGSCSLSHKTKPFSLRSPLVEYDSETKKGTAFFAQGSYDPFFFKAKKIAFSEKKIVLGGATLTTCSGEVPNYKITAKDFHYTPGEKIIGHHISVYAKKTKIFAFPWYYANLRDKQQQAFSPEFGRNDVDGFYFHMGLPFLLGPALPGLILLDWFQKKGFGSGFKQDFSFWNDARLSFSLSGFQNKQTTATSLLSSFKVENPSAGGKLTMNLSRSNTITSSLSETLTDTGNVRYQYKTRDRNSVWEMRYSRIGTTLHSANLRIITREQFRLGATKSLLLTNEVDKNVRTGQSADWEAHTKLQLSGKRKRWSWQVNTERRSDLDQDNFQGDNAFPFFDVLPEIVLTSPSYRKWYLPNTRFLLGHYREGPESVNASRFIWDVSKRKSWRLTHTLRPSLTMSYQQSFYDEGSAKYKYTITPALQHKPSDPLTFTLKYTFSKAKGHTPFKKDKTGDFERKNLSLSTAYRRRSYLGQITTSRDLIAKRWSLLTMENKLLSGQAGNLTLRADYDLNRGEPGNLTFQYQRKRKDFTGTLSLLYNMERHDLLNVMEKAEFPLGRWFLLKSHVQYLPQSRRFTTKDFQLVRDLGCMEASLSYRAVRKEVAFQIFIKAFPTQKFGIGIDERGTSLQQLPF